MAEYGVALSPVDCDNQISEKGTIKEEVEDFMNFLKRKGRKDLANGVGTVFSEIDKKAKITLSKVDDIFRGGMPLHLLCVRGVFKRISNENERWLPVTSTDSHCRSGFLKFKSEFFKQSYNYLAFKGIGDTDSGRFITRNVEAWGLAPCSALCKAYLFSLLFHSAAYLEHMKNKLAFPAPSLIPLRILRLKAAYTKEGDAIPTPMEKIKKDLGLPNVDYGQLFYACQEWRRLENDGTDSINENAAKNVGYALYLAHDVLKGSFSTDDAGLKRYNISIAGEMFDPDHFWSPYLPSGIMGEEHDSCMEKDFSSILPRIAHHKKLLCAFMKGRFPYANEEDFSIFLDEARGEDCKTIRAQIISFRENNLPDSLL